MTFNVIHLLQAISNAIFFVQDFNWHNASYFPCAINWASCIEIFLELSRFYWPLFITIMVPEVRSAARDES